ncbi:type II toxin-antitoxin system VapC family toxin [Sphingomonas sp.]|uniref:type II toxin-antitoxin system VapC family toxin n=1 Tax=Sphingomonas sp. TaxID=28214 RepID=UPI0035BBFD96
MIVDTSVLAAILLAEPGQERFQVALASSNQIQLSAGSWIELGVVLFRKDKAELAIIAERLLETFSIRIAAVDVAQSELARLAYRAFGRGSGHPAKLNFGDCFSYALAKATGEPLLFKGDDFGHTDVLKAIE